MAVVTYIQRYQQPGIWHESAGEFSGNPPMISAMDNGAWIGVGVFDGARAFEGVAPDLDLHCQRLIKSAKHLRLNSPVTLDHIISICKQAISRFPKDAVLYVRQELWAVDGLVLANPDTVHFAVVVHDQPFPSDQFSACISSYRRPDPRTAPTQAKAIAVYTNVHLLLGEAKDKGFDTAVVMDLNGNVAEFGAANMLYVKNNVVYTPTPNACFLNGITRRRVSGLLSEAGYKVVEKITSIDDLYNADEVFSVGNLFKVRACTKIEDKTYPIGPVAKHAKSLYWDFAHGRLQTKTKILI